MKTAQGGRKEVPITAELGLGVSARAVVGEAQVRTSS